jgi:predicted RNA-binding protein with EMAP domain
MQKKKAEWIHARRRALERYDIFLTKKMVAYAVQQIHQGHSVYGWKASNNISIHVIQIGNKKAAVVYDKKRRMIKTFLPPRVAEKILSENMPLAV